MFWSLPWKGQKIFFVEETKKRKGKKVFGKGKLFVEKRKTVIEEGENFGDESFLWRKGKGGKYLEKENIFFCGAEEKRRNKRRKIVGDFAFCICKFVWVKNVVLSILLCHLATSRGIGFCTHFFWMFLLRVSWNFQMPQNVQKLLGAVT